MTDVEIFDRETRHLGGRLTIPSSDPLAIRGYSHVRKVAEVLINSANQLLPDLAGVYFDFVRNPEINAFAFKSEDRYFIGITAGAFYMLELVIMRMLSDSRVFTIIGNPGEECELPPLTIYAPHSQRMFKAGNIAQSPKTPARHAYAVNLIESAIRFLVGHEIAHITLGHVDYMKSKTGAALIAEVGARAADKERLIERQCMEIHADTRSVFSGIESVRLTHKFAGSTPSAWSRKALTEAQLIFDWASAMNLLFRLFGDARFSPARLCTTGYPPLPVRRLLASNYAFGWVVEKWDSGLREKARNALRAEIGRAHV